MKELFEAAFSGLNIIPTGLLIFALLYWLVVMLGFVHVDAIDLDVDVDSDTDAHTVLLSDMHGDGNHGNVAQQAAYSISWFNHVLAFFNLGQIPLMLFLSFLALPMWVISILINHYLGNTSFLFSLLLLIPNFVVSLFIAKVLTTPFVKVFSYLYKDPDQEVVVGKVCTVLLPASHEKVGQAVVKNNGTVLMLNVKTAEGIQLDKGSNALVISFQKDKNCYLIQQLEL